MGKRDFCGRDAFSIEKRNFFGCLSSKDFRRHLNYLTKKNLSLRSDIFLLSGLYKIIFEFPRAYILGRKFATWWGVEPRLGSNSSKQSV